MPAVELPATLLSEVDGLVQSGAFPSREAAIAELVRLGLAALQARRPGQPPFPGRPPMPPGRSEPNDDRPISVEPGDVNWAP